MPLHVSQSTGPCGHLRLVAHCRDNQTISQVSLQLQNADTKLPYSEIFLQSEISTDSTETEGM